MATNVVYLHPNVLVDTSNPVDFKIVAKSDLKPGTLILLEHVASSQHMGAIQAIIHTDMTLFTELWPRSSTDYENFVSDPSEEVEDIAYNKCMKNMFGFNDKFVAGNVFSKFNHSCQPNCHMGLADKVGIDKHVQSAVHVYAMWLHKNVKAGEELTIDYTNGEKHKKVCDMFGIKCACTPQDIKVGRKKSKIQTNLDTAFRLKNEKKINDLVDAYMKTNAAFKAIRVHELAEAGIFIPGNGGGYICGPNICMKSLSGYEDPMDGIKAKVRQIDNHIKHWKWVSNRTK